jgi:anti-anti-sigma regulatory factor
MRLLMLVSLVWLGAMALLAHDVALRYGLTEAEGGVLRQRSHELPNEQAERCDGGGRGRAAHRGQPPGAEAEGARRARGGERKFLIDFTNTGYIDSSGLGVLVSLSKKIREQGGELRLANLNEDLRTLFELTKLDTLFNIADSRDAALSAF